MLHSQTIFRRVRSEGLGPQITLMNADGMKLLRRVERSAGRVGFPPEDPGNERITNRLATDRTDKTDQLHHRHCEEAPPTRQSH